MSLCLPIHQFQWIIILKASAVATTTKTRKPGFVVKAAKN